jgi:hypothetical protein
MTMNVILGKHRPRGSNYAPGNAAFQTLLQEQKPLYKEQRWHAQKRHFLRGLASTWMLQGGTFTLAEIRGQRVVTDNVELIAEKYLQNWMHRTPLVVTNVKATVGVGGTQPPVPPPLDLTTPPLPPPPPQLSLEANTRNTAAAALIIMSNMKTTPPPTTVFMNMNAVPQISDNDTAAAAAGRQVI